MMEDVRRLRVDGGGEKADGGWLRVDGGCERADGRRII